MRDEQLRALIDVWKQTIEVQQHFNDIVLRIRNLALTLLLAVFGAAALALREDIHILIRGVQLSLATAVLAVGLVGWLAFYFIDRFWYHKLLVGAVIHGEALEHIWGHQLLGTGFLGLTGTITRESRSITARSKRVVCAVLALSLWVFVIAASGWSSGALRVLGAVALTLAAWFFATVVWTGGLKARYKLDFFYIAGILILIILAVLANGQITIENPKPIPSVSSTP